MVGEFSRIILPYFAGPTIRGFQFWLCPFSKFPYKNGRDVVTFFILLKQLLYKGTIPKLFLTEFYTDTFINSETFLWNFLSVVLDHF